MEKISMIEIIAKKLENIIIPLDKINSMKELCISIDNLELYEKLYKNLSDNIYILISECVIYEYNDKKHCGEIIGESSDQRTKYFEENFANKLDFSHYFLEKYCILSDLLKKKVVELINFYMEIILSYSNDKEDLEDNFKSEIGKMCNILVQAGDLHNGKAVSIVHFEKQKIVYKPRKIEGEIIVEEFINYISVYLPRKLKFKFPKYLSRGKYTWQEFINQKECINMDEVHNYYYRVGVYLGIFYLFSTLDLHYENMISYGEHPMFIDLETLVRAENSLDNLNQDSKADSQSVLISSLLPVKSTGNFFDVNMSALFTGIQKSKNIYSTILMKDEEDDWIYVKEPAVVKGQHNILLYKGNEIEPHIVENDLINGFVDTMNIIILKKEEFKKMLYKNESNIKIRQVLRPTHIYWKFINASQSPAYLCSDERYNSIFNILYSKFTFGKHGFMRVEKEVEDLKNGNIPLFYTFMNDKNLYSDERLICADYYVETPLDTVIKKICKLDIELIEYQVRMIKMSLLTLYGFDRPKKRISYCEEKTFLSSNDVRDILEEYSNELVKNIIRIDENKYSLLLPVIDSDGYIIDGLQQGIYQVGGIIWYLAAYSKIYNSDYSKYAKGMLNTLISQYTKEKMINNGQLNFSVYSGSGGLLYLVYNFHKIFDDELYLDMSLEIIKDFINYYVNNEAIIGIDDDFYKGLPGALYVVCNIYEDYKLQYNKTICDVVEIDIIGKKLLELINNRRGSNYGLAHGLSGLAISLAALYKITGSNDYAQEIEKLIMEECKLYNESQDNYSWCKGKVGVILARDIMKKKCIENDLLIRTIENSIPDLSEINIKFIDIVNEYGLCHGLYGILEVLKDCGYDEYTDQIYMKYFNSILELKWFEHSEYKLEAFMIGSSGVAYSLMRLYNKLPSILALDVYQ